MLVDKAKDNLVNGVLPFWMNLMDKEYGGFYGAVDYDLKVDKKGEKGTILVSRIMWLFSRAHIQLGDIQYLETARHAYEYFHRNCYDKEYGGLYWSTNYDGTPCDVVKHTYTMSYGIYGLVAYYEASGNHDILDEAYELYHFIEERCTDSDGYLEEFDRFFNVKDNEKVSDALAPRGFYADRTMNTLLHLLEAYTELFRVDNDPAVKNSVIKLLDLFVNKVYCPDKRRLEVFFDKEYNSLVDTQSYGHDIESAWLIDYAVAVLKSKGADGDKYVSELFEQIGHMNDDLRDSVYNRALKDNRMTQDNVEGVDNNTRVWWVHAEAVNGFSKGFTEQPDHPEYKDAAMGILDYIEKHFIDSRSGEWYNELDGKSDLPKHKELAGPWKCPYHNGRMWLELMNL